MPSIATEPEEEEAKDEENKVKGHVQHLVCFHQEAGEGSPIYSPT